VQDFKYLTFIIIIIIITRSVSAPVPAAATASLEAANIICCWTAFNLQQPDSKHGTQKQEQSKDNVG